MELTVEQILEATRGMKLEEFLAFIRAYLAQAIVPEGPKP